MTHAQSLSEQAFQSAKNNEFQNASRLYLQALEQARSVENDDLTYDIYEKLQDCYLSLFKLDSSVWIFEQAENFAKSRGNYKKYFDFKLGRAEIKYILGERKQSTHLFREIVDNSEAKSYHLIRAHLRLASLSNVQSDSAAAYHHIQVAMQQAQLTNDSNILGGVYETFAFIESEYGSTFKAIDFYQKAIPFFEHQNKGFRLGSINRRISYIFQTLGNVDKALDFCHEALVIAEKYNHKSDMAQAESLLGELYMEKESYNKAKEYFERSLTHYSSKLKKDKITSVYSHLAAAEMKLENEKSALKHLKNARIYINDHTSINAKFHFILRKAKYEIKYGNNAIQTKRNVDSCELIASRSDNEYIKQHTLKLQVDYYRKIKDFETALLKKEEHVNLSKKIRKRNQSQLVHDLEAKYQNELLDKEVVQLNTVNQLNESKLNQQKIIINIIIFALILMGLFGYSFYRLYKRVDAQNEIIDKALGEKELLLREIHHRVKNNLQVISSLLSLQSGYVQDDKAIEALKHGQDRVQSMALIHQDLYQADNLKGVNVQKYFERLVDNLLDSYQVDEGVIELDIEVDPIVLDVDTMIPLGLIVNELISNVLKHAFEGRAGGKVELRLKEIEEMLILKVKDNGVGLKNVDELSGDTFGFQMIQAFANKLKARIDVNHENGLEVQLSIKNYMKIT